MGVNSEDEGRDIKGVTEAGGSTRERSQPPSEHYEHLFLHLTLRADLYTVPFGWDELSLEGRHMLMHRLFTVGNSQCFFFSQVMVCIYFSRIIIRLYIR